MTRARTLDFTFAAKALFAALLLAAAVATITPAFAQGGNKAILDAARAAGQIGEQADGYIGIPPGGAPSADVRARMDQTNIQRRQVYTALAGEQHVSPSEVAATAACRTFADNVVVGAKYRDEGGQWRTRTAGQPAPRPSYCPAG